MISLQFLLVLFTIGFHVYAAPGKRDYLCNRVWPATGGVFKTSPPYWTLPGCPTQAFSRENVTSCMKGRTLYVMGNSVARQNAINMVELLGGYGVLRENQKEMCPRHGTTWGDSCHQEFVGVKIRYLFLQYMDGFDYTNRSGFPFYRHRVMEDGKYTLKTGRLPDRNSTYGMRPNDLAHTKTSFGEDDSCILKSMRACLREFFADSKEDDVLIFTQGTSYPLPSKEEVAAQELKALAGEPQLDMQAWLTASASAFQAHVAATFKGQVFQVMTAQLHSRKSEASLTPMMHRVNDLLYTLWQGSSEDRPWHTIDQWAINQDREYMYNDHVHFNGPLSHATLYQMLNELCPEQGDPSPVAWPMPSLALHVIYKPPVHANLPTEYFLVNPDGYRLSIHNDPSNQLPWYFAQYPLLAMNDDELLAVPLDAERLDYIPDNTPLQGHGRTVYVLLDKVLRAFPSADVFNRHGYSFEKVVRISDEYLEVFPAGPDMS